MTKLIIKIIVVLIAFCLPLWGSWELGGLIQSQFENTDLGTIVRIFFHVFTFGLTIAAALLVAQITQLILDHYED